MQPTEYDDALRELVAELASAGAEDVDAVLEMLDYKSANEVRSLLKAYMRMESLFDLEVQDHSVDALGLTPWLADRVRMRSLNGALPFEITAQCNEALRDLARLKLEAAASEGSSDRRHSRIRGRREE